MVQRRERCKRQMIIVNEDITRLELRLLEEETLKGNKQPLCLKRLVSQFSLMGTPICICTQLVIIGVIFN